MKDASQLELVIGISGASGALYSCRFVQALASHVVGRSFLVVSPAALRVYRQERDSKVQTPEEYLDEVLTGMDASSCLHQFQIEDHANIGAVAASGSAHHDGMVIIPCSTKSLASIAHGISTNLIERAAEVCLKEQRRLIVVPRETPYSQIHLENMLKLSGLGVIVLAASPGFYHKPKSLNDLGDFIAGRILSLFQIKHQLFSAWDGKG